MKKEEIFKKYRSKTLDIEGFNLLKVNDAMFNHLYEHFLFGLEVFLIYRKRLDELVEESKKEGISMLSKEHLTKKEALKKELNTREQNGEFPLTEEHKKILQFLETLYFDSLETNIHAKSLQIADGKVIIPKAQIYHECSLTALEQFESYADLGIIATEWFGVIESQGEGGFCTFVKNDRLKNDFEGDLTQNVIKFYIDNTHTLWQKLSSLDYFEYEHLKKISPEKIIKIYPKEIVDLYEEIVEPLSKSGREMHSDPNSYMYTWQAIPGGIPPQLIIGVQIGSKKEQLIAKSDEIQKLFPNAVIFDDNHNVLSNPTKNKENTSGNGGTGRIL